MKRLNKNTNAERYIALANAETRLVDGDNYLDSVVLSYLIIKRSNYITLNHFFYIFIFSCNNLFKSNNMLA